MAQGEGGYTDISKGLIEYNHMGPHETGPLKADFSKSCPWNWSLEKQASDCVDWETAVWGSTLSKLKEAKLAFDPNHRFNCYHCVGYQSLF